MRINSQLNKLLSGLLLIAIVISCCGCSSKMKCVVQGKPDTTIYNTNHDKVGYIDNSGFGEVVLDRHMKHDFIYARENSNSPIIPIGLNYDKRHNEFRSTKMWITLFPSVGLSALAMGDYEGNNGDVADELKLHKQQTANQDLASLIYSASTPIEEIQTLKPRQTKSGRSTEPSSNFALSWINQDGKISKLTSLSIVTNAVKKSQSFKGTIDIYHLGENSRPMIRIKGRLGNGSELNYTIHLASPFKKVRNAYIAKEKESNADVKIYPSTDGTAILSFSMNGLNVELAFNPDSFKENSYEPSETDLFEMIFDH